MPNLTDLFALVGSPIGSFKATSCLLNSQLKIERDTFEINRQLGFLSFW